MIKGPALRVSKEDEESEFEDFLVATSFRKLIPSVYTAGLSRVDCSRYCRACMWYGFYGVR